MNKLKTRKILLLFIIVISLIFSAFMLNKTKFVSHDKTVIVKTYGNDENLIDLKIIDKRHHLEEIKYTNSSKYQRFKISFWGNNNFLFDSSDTGTALFQYNKNRWHGMNVFAFPNSKNEFIVILLPQEEKMKQTDGIDRQGYDLKDNRISLKDKYELLILAKENISLATSAKWHLFSLENPPYDAVKWLNANEFILTSEERPVHFIINIIDSKVILRNK